MSVAFVSETALDGAQALLRRVETESTVYLVDPRIDDFATVVVAATRVSRPPTIDVLLDPTVYRRVQRWFPAAARLGDLVADDTVSVRHLAEIDTSPVIITPEHVAPILRVGSIYRVVPAEEPTRLSALQTAVARLWDRGTAVDTDDLPRWSTLVASARETLGDSVAAGVKTALTVADETENARDFDPTRAFVLVAAARESLLLETGGWTTETNVASRATVSRKKGELEAENVLTTEQTEIPVGRPRQRLLLTDAATATLDEHGLRHLLERHAVS